MPVPNPRAFCRSDRHTFVLLRPRGRGGLANALERRIMKLNQSKGSWLNPTAPGSTLQLVSPGRHRVAISCIANFYAANRFDKLDRAAAQLY